MKLRISNLGPIRSMEFDLSKPFMLFAGDNGTGKTYAASFIYTLLRSIPFAGGKETIEKALVNRRKVENGPVEKGEIDAGKLYDIVKDSLDEEMETVLNRLNLNVSAENFSCELLTGKDSWVESVRKADVSFPGFRKIGGTNGYSFNIGGLESMDQDFFLSLYLRSLILDGILFSTMYPAERNGIYTFVRELAAGRFRSPERGGNSNYPFPISDGLANAIQLKLERNVHSSFYDLADEIERDILHGALSVKDDGEILFSANESSPIAFNCASSTIKALAPVVFYLRYEADTANFLIIDEPELNLHPKNQVLLAKVFVKMVNRGVRLLVSTHSDYIIREINNAIMADGLRKRGDSAAEKHGYPQDYCLDKDKFAAYLFEFNKDAEVDVESLPVDDFGFSMPSIDRTIERQNEVTNDFYDLLKYDYKV